MTVIKNNQPWLLRIVAAMLAVTVLVLLGIAAYVYWLTFDPKQIAEGADNIHGLYIGAAVVGGAGVVFLIATLLLWKRWRAMVAFAGGECDCCRCVIVGPDLRT